MQRTVRTNTLCLWKKHRPRESGPRFRTSSNPVNSIGCGVVQADSYRFLHQGGVYFPLLKLSVGRTNNLSNIYLWQRQRRIFSMTDSQKSKEMEGEEENDNIVTVLEDNPCWGSPTRHQLKDLLALIDRDTSILYDSPQYLVLNKPPDLRMDGPYPATVHKLLTYWFTPPSLVNLCKRKSTIENSITAGGDTENSNSSHDTLLLEAVSRLHQHNDATDNFLRPCHQLDYATSGILLVAKTKEAAGHIGRLFEERHQGVKKSYVAVLVGNLRRDLLSKSNETEIETDDSSAKVPVWTGGSTTQDLREQLQRLEKNHRRSRGAAGKQHRRMRGASNNKGKKMDGKSSITRSTFEGFQPAHSIFSKWKSRLRSISAENRSTERGQTKSDEESSSSPSKKKRRKFKRSSAGAHLTDNDWQRIWEPVKEAHEAIKKASTSTIDFETIEWKQLKMKHPTLKNAILRATDTHNDILRNAIREAGQKEQHEVGTTIGGDGTKIRSEFPTLFRLAEDSDIAGNCDEREHSAHKTGPSDSTFYVCCPLAQHPDQFNMVVPNSVARSCSRISTPPGSTTNRDEDVDASGDKIGQLKFRPSLTKCTILEHGTLFVVRNNRETKIEVTKVRLYPMTGRRHQLRVHMALAGFPILGDVAYGRVRDAYRNDNHLSDEKGHHIEVDICSRMCLHAQSLELPTLLGENKRNWKIGTSDPFVFGPDGRLQIK